MKITRVETWSESFELSRPYAIARRTIEAVELFFVRLVCRGVAGSGRATGVGSASPAEGVTGETPASCAAALESDRLEWLVGRDPRHLGALCREVQTELAETPAAAAALDMALHDLFARLFDVPLVDVLGRCHRELPTSITVGIQSTEEALEDAREFLGRGFRCLKIKVGRALEEDLERLTKLRELAGPAVTIRVDANQGYDVDAFFRFVDATRALDLELIEQPLERLDAAALAAMPADLRRRVAADESLHGPADAFALAGRCGIFNIKLMKCGGIRPALEIARLAELRPTELMWGCMDESALSIAAALHAAYASPQTRYLDLDGSLDLAGDPATGGFVVQDGIMRLVGGPGLGIALRERS